MVIDADYMLRLELLYTLTEKSPNKPMRDLQRECLKYYPLYYKESIRAWMSIKTAFKCFDVFCPLHEKINISGEQC